MSKRRKDCGKGEGGNVIGNKCMSQKSKRKIFLRGVQQLHIKQRDLWVFTKKLRYTIVMCLWQVVKHFLLQFLIYTKRQWKYMSFKLPSSAVSLDQVNRNSQAETESSFPSFMK